MDDDIGLGMQEQPSLLADGFHHLRVAVTRIRHTYPAGEIEVFSAIHGIDIAPFGAFRFNRKNPRPDGGHVGEILIVELSHV